MQSLQIHDLSTLLGPNAKPLLDQIYELKQLKSEYEQTVQQAREKENNIAELYRANASALDHIQYENTRRQQELLEMKAALELRAANYEQREIQFQERLKQLDLREAQLQQLDAQVTHRYNEVAQREQQLAYQAQAVFRKEQQLNQTIEDLKNYLRQIDN